MISTETMTTIKVTSTDIHGHEVSYVVMGCKILWYEVKGDAGHRVLDIRLDGSNVSVSNPLQFIEVQHASCDRGLCKEDFDALLDELDGIQPTRVGGSKGVLQFDLPEDSCAHKIAVHAMDWAFSVDDLERWLRDQVRYHNREELQEVRDMLRDILGGRGISTDDIE